MSEGTLFKPEKDFSKEADKIIPDAQKLANVSNVTFERASIPLANDSFFVEQDNVQAALDKLSLLEKQARQVDTL